MTRVVVTRRALIVAWICSALVSSSVETAWSRPNELEGADADVSSTGTDGAEGLIDLSGGERLDLLGDEPVDAPTAAELGAAKKRFARGLELFDDATQFREQNPSKRREASERFRRAAREFLAASRRGLASTEVFTNAGNAFFFAGDTGEAVLSYRRALAIKPSNRSARTALDSIRGELPIRKRTSSARTLTESLFFWHDERYFTLRLWAFYALFPAAWLLLVVELLRRRWPASRWLLILVVPAWIVAELAKYLFRFRRPYAIAGAVLMIPALAALGSLLIEAFASHRGEPAVVLVETQGRNGNGEQYQTSHSAPFPPGTEVRVHDRRLDSSGRAWCDVTLLDGSNSWVSGRAIEPVVQGNERSSSPTLLR